MPTPPPIHAPSHPARTPSQSTLAPLPRPAVRRISTWRWVTLVGVLAFIEGLGLTAYLLRSPAPTIEDALASGPLQRCAARGEQVFLASGQWPVTHEGRDAQGVVLARCQLDANAFS